MQFEMYVTRMDSSIAKKKR